MRWLGKGEEDESYQTIGFTLLLIKGCLVQNAETAWIRDEKSWLAKGEEDYRVLSLSIEGCWVQNADVEFEIVRWLARDKKTTGLDNGVQNASKELGG